MTEDHTAPDSPLSVRFDRRQDELDIHLMGPDSGTVADDLIETFNDGGVPATRGFYASGTGAFVAIAVGLGGGTGIAAILNAYFGRNRHRKITIRQKHKEISVQGLSVDEIADLINGIKED